MSIRVRGCSSCANLSAAGLANPDAEHLGRANRRAALLALDRERRWKRRRALGAAVPGLAAAVRARGREVTLSFEEVAPDRAARETEARVVAERLAPFLLNPVAFRLHHL